MVKKNLEHALVIDNLFALIQIEALSDWLKKRF